MEASSGAHALYCFAEAVAAAASAAPAEAQGEYVEPAVASSTSPVCAPSAAGDAAGPALASSCAPGAGDGPSAGAAATLTPAAAAHDDDGAAPASTPPDADEAPDADEVAPNADDASPDADEAPDADDADDADEEPHDPDEPTWCVCDRGFFGEMVGCDGEDKCEFGGWFHIECVGLARAPRGEWRCASCTEKHAITSERKKRKADKDRALAKRLRPDSATHIVVEEGPSRSSYTLKIETAEDQSRREMERLIGGARGIRFSQGRAVGEPDIEGLCRLELVKKTFAAISSLHKTIVKRLRKEKMLVPWAGVNEGDARERGYAFLPKSMGTFGKKHLKAAGLKFHSAHKTGSDALKDEVSNWKSCITLEEDQVTARQRAALEALVAQVREAVSDKYKCIISLENLQALQPNLHNSTTHLPPHLDAPLNDGFGVVIVTVAVVASANILILNSQHKAKKGAWQFVASQGEAYVLSGNARNACDHGVFCPLPSKRARAGEGPRPGRESLNLRFGIHGNTPRKPFYLYDEVQCEF